MLSQLSTVKSRLALTVTDYDDLLTAAVRAVSARLDKEPNRTLSRTDAVCQDFDATDTEILPACYPIESVPKFEIKSNETDGWSEQTGVQYLIRHQCVSLLPPRHQTLDTCPRDFPRRLRPARHLPHRRPNRSLNDPVTKISETFSSAAGYWREGQVVPANNNLTQ